SPLHLNISQLLILSFLTSFPPIMTLTGSLLQDLPGYEVVHPTRVDAKGHFLSNFLPHHAHHVQRREASQEPVDVDQVFYQLWHSGHSLHFNLTLNPHLLAPGFLTERRFGGLDGAQIRPPRSSRCHFLGEVWDGDTVKGNAAISTCDGLTGLFKLSGEEFFIQPLEKWNDETSAPQAHAIYRRHVSPPSRSSLIQPISGKQAVNDSHQTFEDKRERWERRQQRRRRRLRQRSISKEKWVETLVVADPKMVQHHGSKAVESYILAVMNIVAGLFQDASIGNAINIVVVRLILLEKDEDDLKITHHADNSLNSFCKWQKRLNTKGDEHPLHHDVAVLLTRKDICSAINMPCETLGLSHVAGMCQLHRSCSINEDTGLPLAFTVAHELGHNFGIPHDGSGNDCEPIGKQPFIMSPQLLYGTSLPRWSRCSRQHITRFLDRGWGWCLDDTPVKDKLSLSTVLPGVLYSATHQCRLQYGSGSRLCDDMDDVCSTLWCTVGATCHSKLDGAVDGTSCGENKWCFSGECVAAGYHPESVSGGWAPWSEWSACSRTCGGGIQGAQRDCDNPVPKNRGRYCLGERQRYKTCNTKPCPHSLPSFRDIQCGHFNAIPYKGKFYKWEAVINRGNPCELHCHPLNEHFSEKMRDAVIDGTPCHEGNKSRDMCINGICKKIGCDYMIDSTAIEDRCGVCHGNGSTCTTVRRTFEESEGLGYVDIGLIPEGAWDIRIEEVVEAGNFLALRSDTSNKYFLNGGWTIQWNGEYKAAGTVFTYVRMGHLENLVAPGPTMEPLWIQLLFQESNPGVRYEYTISQNVAEERGTTASPVFFWKYGSWTQCSVTCGTGFQRKIVHCVEKTTGIVEEQFCDPLTQPDNNQTSCNKDPCPALWWVGEWQKCSASCGSSGLSKRAVLCVQAVSVEEQKALQPSDCEHIPKPESLSPCNTHIPCPADWTTGSWSKCSLTCGNGVRRRNVTCSRNTGVDCDPQKKPSVVSTCHLQDCPRIVDNFGDTEWSGKLTPSTVPILPTHPAVPLPVPTSVPTSPSTQATTAYWVTGNWSACSTTCGLGAIWRTLACSTGSDADCDPAKRPAPAQQCYLRPCSSWKVGEWNKCSKNCEGGIKLREVQCFDMRNQRLLRPFHCRAMSPRPQTQMPCNSQSCLKWYTSSWGLCSEVCGGGEQQRIVTCPEEDQCDRALQPSIIQTCNSQPCSQWLTGSWGQCSASCGGGVQHRLIKCVNTKAETDEEVEEAQCDHEPKPESAQKCNLQECESAPFGEHFEIDIFI
uniref:Peptidase M12B domain-containing protein n=1 Tax=Anabas testudineus TaxID=64144 RepID=A0A7N6FHP0_ANATE